MGGAPDSGCCVCDAEAHVVCLLVRAEQQRGVPSSAMFEDASVSEEWDAKKTQVLSRFAAQGTITVSTTFDVVGRAKRG